MRNTGLVSDLQHFSTGDGPGIRTTVFLKGCNLHCEWCHNPETISARPELLHYEQLCSLCGACERACPRGVHEVNPAGHRINRQACTACGACTADCPFFALKISGEEMQLSDVMDFILADIDFYRSSGGGVTISGGEPMLQAEFSASIASECKKHGLHVIIDTAGNVDFSMFRLVLPYTDIFYFDLKGATEADYCKKTGGSLTMVLENITRLTASGCRIVARIPIIPGYNDSIEYCGKMMDLLVRTGCRHVHLLPFHRMGSIKYRALGLDWQCQGIEPPGAAQMHRLGMLFRNMGFIAEVES